MAACNPTYTAPRPPHGPIFSHRLDEICTARRLKPAVAANQWAQRPLVDPDHANQQRAGKLPDLMGQTLHRFTFPDRFSLRLDRASIRTAMAISDSASWCSGGGAGERATHTKSSAGN